MHLELCVSGRFEWQSSHKGICTAAEKLKEEESRRRAVEDQSKCMDDMLAALKREANALRLAAEEHAK